LNDYLVLLQTVGFPIFMCLWFMFRLEKLIQNNTSALLKVIEVLDKT